jgi:hypothetical protein
VYQSSGTANTLQVVGTTTKATNLVQVLGTTLEEMPTGSGLNVRARTLVLFNGYGCGPLINAIPLLATGGTVATVVNAMIANGLVVAASS